MCVYYRTDFTSFLLMPFSHSDETSRRIVFLSFSLLSILVFIHPLKNDMSSIFARHPCSFAFKVSSHREELNISFHFAGQSSCRFLQCDTLLRRGVYLFLRKRHDYIYWRKVQCRFPLYMNCMSLFLWHKNFKSFLLTSFYQIIQMEYIFTFLL